MNRTRTLVAMLLAVALVPSPPAFAQEQPTEEELAALMTKALELAQPGPEHERLAALAGSWAVEITMWPQPGAEPFVTEATGEAEMILGGRFLMMKQVITEGVFASESIAILGFDRRTDEYTLLGLDTIGTYWVSAQGPASGANGAVLSGEDHDAVIGGTQVYDFVMRWEDNDTWVTELIFRDEFHTRGGGPFKMMESVARRR